VYSDIQHLSPVPDLGNLIPELNSSAIWHLINCIKVLYGSAYSSTIFQLSFSLSPPSSVSQQAGRWSMKKKSALDARNSLKFSAYSPNTAKYFPCILYRCLISFHIFSEYAESSVADPWHFDVDPDLDPGIHASDQWIRILFIFRYRV
jgi:hypothetical protein